MNKIYILLLFFYQLIGCNGQSSQGSTSCNRNVYGNPKYIANLPAYICIPTGYIIDDYVRVSDTDGDRQIDLIAVKYNKKEDNQIDGDSTYWAFYSNNKSDTIFSLNLILANIVPPFVKNISYEYLGKNSLAANLFADYPRRMSNRLSFQLNFDTIRLAYKFDDSFGKRFVFVRNQTNWYLRNIEYFIGELPMYWWNENEFYYSLNDSIKIIETKKPANEVSIANFDLKTAFKYREEELSHLTEWHIDKIDKNKYGSIDKVVFPDCTDLNLPADWQY